MRLQHFLALAGVGSRRKCEKLIASGHVRVNGEVVLRPGTKIDPEHDEVLVDQRRVKAEKKFYVLLNKPRGYLSAVVDQRGRPTVNKLVNDLPARLYPVGRLDMDTEGVLLMTNDGELCHQMTHPRFGVEKAYHAEVKGRPTRQALAELSKGVELEDGKTWPAGIRLVKSDQNRSIVEIIIHEGRKRQVKRMCKAVGYPVVRLKRVEFGGIRLGNLKPGQYRLLSDSEVERLAKMAFQDQ